MERKNRMQNCLSSQVPFVASTPAGKVSRASRHSKQHLRVKTGWEGDMRETTVGSVPKDMFVGKRQCNRSAPWA